MKKIVPTIHATIEDYSTDGEYSSGKVRVACNAPADAAIRLAGEIAGRVALALCECNLIDSPDMILDEIADIAKNTTKRSFKVLSHDIPQ